MVNPTQGLQHAVADVSSTAGSKQNSGDSQFLDTLHSAIGQVSDLQSEADTKVAAMLKGNGEDVHSAMIAVEKADLAFELMVQVRNKIVSAYQEVSRMSF